jgi:hypothetical protein
MPFLNIAGQSDKGRNDPDSYAATAVSSPGVSYSHPLCRMSHPHPPKVNPRPSYHNTILS